MIVVAGEALVDLAPRNGLLAPLPGGSPYNVAVGLGRLGSDTAYLGALSTDGFGRVLIDRLDDAGVSLAFAPRTDQPTTLAVVHLDERSTATYGFYLAGTSGTQPMHDAVQFLPDRAAVHVSVGAVTAATNPAGPALVELLATTDGFTSLDPNVRPTMITDRPAYAATIDALVAEVDLVKVSDEDLHLLHPDADDPLVTARRWAASGPALVVVTRGPDGAVGLRPDGSVVEVAGEPVTVADTVGAGDAFTSGLLAWCERQHLLDADALRAADDAALADALRAAVHLAAVTCTRAGGDPPRLAQLTRPPWA